MRASVVAAILVTTACAGEDMKANPVSLAELDASRAATGLLVPWRDGSGQSGYADRTGAIRIKPQFAGADLFHEGLAAAARGDKWGFINASGDFQIAPRYSSVGRFEHGQTTAYQFVAPWLGPIMGWILRKGELTTHRLDRMGTVLQSNYERTNDVSNLWPEEPTPDTRSTDWIEFRNEGRVGLQQVSTKATILPAQYESVQLIVDADGSGVKFLAGKKGNNEWAVFNLAGKELLASTMEVHPIASEGAFIARGPKSENWWGAYDGTGKRFTDDFACMPFVFRNGIAAADVADVGTVYVDRSGRLYADAAYIKSRHDAVGRSGY
jgi:hypothetical protein